MEPAPTSALAPLESDLVPDGRDSGEDQRWKGREGGERGKEGKGERLKAAPIPGTAPTIGSALASDSAPAVERSLEQLIESGVEPLSGNWS